MKTEIDEVSARLQQVRQWFKQTPHEFAHSLGTKERTYYRYERGEREMPLSLLKALAGLGIDLNWFITGVNRIDSSNAPDNLPQPKSILKARTAIRLKVNACLRLRGLTLTLWAEKHGYNFGSVTQSLQKFAGNAARPKGTLSQKIISELESETGITICGGEFDAAAPTAAPAH